MTYLSAQPKNPPRVLRPIVKHRRIEGVFDEGIGDGGEGRFHRKVVAKKVGGEAAQQQKWERAERKESYSHSRLCRAQYCCPLPRNLYGVRASFEMFT